MREFAFELRLCAHLEAASDSVVARQLGTAVHDPGGRIVDVVHVKPGPAFDARTDLTPDEIPVAVLEADVGVGRWRRVTDAFDGPAERARRLADAGVEAGFLERTRRGGHDVVRQATRYPEGWFDSLVGIENKPDLGEPGALEAQLRHDVSLGVLDEVVLATESYVTGAHLNRIPEEVGVWSVDFDREDPVEVVREATPLDAAGPGVEVLDSHPLRTDVRVASAESKARQRRRVAERAYGKGWRTYDLPACERAETDSESGTDGLPHCAWKGRLVDAAAECGPDCPGYAESDAPDVDLDAERARRTAWNPDPGGAARRQAGLDDF
ncbi:DUF5787 family protein [Halospeciosus flavus]|uniref:DUF5787 family protein n=1 Tax=Halospeciosus flavus TaxID=3032283 RepID=A0ABD5Z8C8_9EURY|nr:DUF5787 family protein [Halospeciosus flavus]